MRKNSVKKVKQKAAAEGKKQRDKMRKGAH